jgi:four helix bundle protein
MTAANSPRKIQNHRDLIVWQKAVELSAETHRLAEMIRQNERHLLRDQMLRAAMSVGANIAEGHGRVSKPEFVRFLGFARGSVQELDTHIETAREIGCISKASSEHARNLVDEINRMLWTLMKRLGTRTLTQGTAKRPR